MSKRFVGFTVDSDTIDEFNKTCSHRERSQMITWLMKRHISEFNGKLSEREKREKYLKSDVIPVIKEMLNGRSINQIDNKESFNKAVKHKIDVTDTDIQYCESLLLEEMV